MKDLILPKLRAHVLTLRFGLTVTFLQYLLWLKMTDRGDDLLETLALAGIGFGLGLAWIIQTLFAILKPPLRKRLPGLGIELLTTMAFLAFTFSEVPFLMAFPLSRPALERFVKEADLPKTPKEEYKSKPQRIGLLRVLSARRDKEGNLALLIHSNMSYAHFMVWCPNGRPARYDSYGPFLEKHWYRYSYGM